VGVCVCHFRASICVQCGCALVLAQVGGIERLFLRRDRRLQTEAIVMLCEPSMESDVCEWHSEKNARDFWRISHRDEPCLVVRDLRLVSSVSRLVVRDARLVV
jgi:hypothetical protein